MNDNHDVGYNTFYWLREDVASLYVQIHVAAGDWEDVRLRATLPGGVGNECRENVWDITTTIGVTQH